MKYIFGEGSHYEGRICIVNRHKGLGYRHGPKIRPSIRDTMAEPLASLLSTLIIKRMTYYIAPLFLGASSLALPLANQPLASAIITQSVLYQKHSRTNRVSYPIRVQLRWYLTAMSLIPLGNCPGSAGFPACEPDSRTENCAGHHVCPQLVVGALA